MSKAAKHTLHGLTLVIYVRTGVPAGKRTIVLEVHQLQLCASSTPLQQQRHQQQARASPPGTARLLSLARVLGCQPHVAPARQCTAPAGPTCNVKQQQQQQSRPVRGDWQQPSKAAARLRLVVKLALFTVCHYVECAATADAGGCCLNCTQRNSQQKNQRSEQIVAEYR